MIRDYRDHLEDILGSLDETREFTEGMSFEAFTKDRKTVNAVIRSLEVFGEAAKHIPENLRAKAPGVLKQEQEDANVGFCQPEDHCGSTNSGGPGDRRVLDDMVENRTQRTLVADGLCGA
jgi:hypothetical protein